MNMNDQIVKKIKKTILEATVNEKEYLKQGTVATLISGMIGIGIISKFLPTLKLGYPESFLAGVMYGSPLIHDFLPTPKGCIKSNETAIFIALDKKQIDETENCINNDRSFISFNDNSIQIIGNSEYANKIRQLLKLEQQEFNSQNDDNKKVIVSTIDKNNPYYQELCRAVLEILPKRAYANDDKIEILHNKLINELPKELQNKIPNYDNSKSILSNCSIQ